VLHSDYGRLSDKVDRAAVGARLAGKIGDLREQNNGLDIFDYASTTTRREYKFSGGLAVSARSSGISRDSPNARVPAPGNPPARSPRAAASSVCEIEHHAHVLTSPSSRRNVFLLNRRIILLISARGAHNSPREEIAPAHSPLCLPLSLSLSRARGTTAR
jgi:hypothetical protein